MCTKGLEVPTHGFLSDVGWPAHEVIPRRAGVRQGVGRIRIGRGAPATNLLPVRRVLRAVCLRRCAWYDHTVEAYSCDE